jgi:hypothetical protein
MSAFVPKPTPKTKAIEESRFERILRIAAAHKTTATPPRTPRKIGDKRPM